MISQTHKQHPPLRHRLLFLRKAIQPHLLACRRPPPSFKDSQTFKATLQLLNTANCLSPHNPSAVEAANTSRILAKVDGHMVHQDIFKIRGQVQIHRLMVLFKMRSKVLGGLLLARMYQSTLCDVDLITSMVILPQASGRLTAPVCPMGIRHLRRSAVASTSCEFLLNQ